MFHVERFAVHQPAHLHQTAGIGCNQGGGVGVFGLAQLFVRHRVGDFGHAHAEQPAKSAAALRLGHLIDGAAGGLQALARLFFNALHPIHMAGVVVANGARLGGLGWVPFSLMDEKLAEFEGLVGQPAGVFLPVRLIFK